MGDNVPHLLAYLGCHLGCHLRCHLRGELCVVCTFRHERPARKSQSTPPPYMHDLFPWSYFSLPRRTLQHFSKLQLSKYLYPGHGPLGGNWSAEIGRGLSPTCTDTPKPHPSTVPLLVPGTDTALALVVQKPHHLAHLVLGLGNPKTEKSANPRPLSTSNLQPPFTNTNPLL